MESPTKNLKYENGMSMTFPKFSESEISKTNNSNSNNLTSFAFSKFEIFDTDSSTISEFMSLSLLAKIEKFKLNPSYRKLRDKNSSNTFLHYICMNDENYDLMDIIKPTKKEIDKQNNIGQTCLHIAIMNKNKKIAEYLIKNGANLNISDNNLNSSLHLAVINNDLELIKILLKYGANPLLVNKNNETVLDIAIKMNYKECINFWKNVSLMNETKNNKNNIIDLKQKIIDEKSIINGNENNNKTQPSNIKINNNIFSHKIINYKRNQNNILYTPKKKNIIALEPNTFSLYKNNIFFTSKKEKSKARTNSTTPINTISTKSKFGDKIYSKKVINRSQSTKYSNKIYQNQTYKLKKVLIDNDNIDNIENDNENLNIDSYQNKKPRKTDIIMQNELLLDSDNESIEEEESVIKDNIITNNITNKKSIEKNNNNSNINNKSNNPNNNVEKIIESFTSLKTIKITPLTETKNKINPYTQLDSFVNAIHKNDQGISESDGYIKEDGLIIIEPSIDITNINDKEKTIIKPRKNKEKNEKIKKDNKEDLYKFLEKIEMEEYSDILIKEGFDDINLVINQMKNGNPINDDILREIGIERPGDRAKILIRMQECAKLFEFKIPFDTVYYINRKKFEFLKYDFHVKALQNWLKKLNLQNYLERFYNNGYYSPELIFIQKASKFPINDITLERDLKIENVNDRKLIMNSISSNSKNYISELKKKNISIKNKNSNNKDKEDNACIIF